MPVSSPKHSKPRVSMSPARVISISNRCAPRSVTFSPKQGQRLPTLSSTSTSPVMASSLRAIITSFPLALALMMKPVSRHKRFACQTISDRLPRCGSKRSSPVFDLARANPFVKNGNPLSSGLALVNPEPNTFIAFNAAPGTVAPDEAGPYSAYAQALAETSREAGLTFDDVFARVRLRVNDLTKGAEVPWHASKLQTPVYLFNRAANAPAPRVSVEQAAAIRKRPIREFDAKEAYLAALDRDTLQGYLDFLAVYPRDAMASRVRAIVAARREAIIWRRSRTVDTPAAYWSYMRRYPRGAHTYDAQRRLAYLSASFAPPRRFVEIVYDVPPPPPDEIVYVERPILTFGDPEFDFAPPPPPPVIFLPPPPVYFVDLPRRRRRPSRSSCRAPSIVRYRPG